MARRDANPPSWTHEKRAAPKERVRMTKDTVTDEEHVSEEVRKEQIAADGGKPGPVV